MLTSRSARFADIGFKARKQSRGRCAVRPYDVVFYAPRLTPLVTVDEDPAPGGAEVQILLLARELAARGHSVGLVVRKPEAPTAIEMAGITIVLQPSHTGGPQVVRSLRNALSTIRTLWSLDAAVFVQRAAGRETALVALIARMRRRRFVYSSANVIDFAYARLDPRWINVALFHVGIRLANQVVVQTVEQQVLCRARFNRSSVVVRSIAEPATPRSTKPEAFLWVARLAPYKQPVKFVDLARRLPNARFLMLLAGEGQAADELRFMVDDARKELSNLEVLPARPRRQLARLLDRAVAVVNTADYEGMPNVFLEAWSRGVPALALSHDPDGLITKEGLGAFAAGDPAQFVELARELWNRRYEQERVALRCIRYVKREHSPTVAAAGWARVLGLSSVDRNSTTRSALAQARM